MVDLQSVSGQPERDNTRDDDTRFEVINGVVSVHPRPLPRHGRVIWRTSQELASFDGGNAPGGWYLLPEPTVHLGAKPEIVIPDVAGWRTMSLASAPDAESAISVPPDWVCEVLSPSTAARDRAIKMPLYAHFGVSHAWLVDPEAQLVEVYTLGVDGRWIVVTVVGGDERVRLAPFEAVEINLARLWSTR